MMEKLGFRLFATQMAWPLAILALCALSPANASDTAAPAKSVEGKAKCKTKGKEKESGDKPLSDKKFSAINKLIGEYLNAGEDLKDSTVQKSIFDDINAKFPVKAGSEPVNMDTDAVATLVRKKVEERFPESLEDYVKRQRKEAEQMFQTAKLREQVKVEYQQGDTVYAVSGTYYGITPGGKSIDIGNRQVPIVDLLPEYRAKVYERYCAEQRRDYVTEKLREYQQERNGCSAEIYAKLRDELTKKNEINGYVEVWQKWRTPVNVAEVLLRDLVDKNAKPGENAAKTPSEAAVETDTTSEAATDSAAGEDTALPDSTVAEPESRERVDKRPLEERRKEVEKLASRKLEDIRLRNSGIDADQGFKLATWGMSHEQVCLLFKLNPDAQQDATMEKVSFNKGFLNNLEFHFVNNKLYKVVADFRIGTPEAMSSIFENIKMRYGISDEERKLRAKRGADGKNAAISAAGATAPVEALYNWSGAVTKGKLYVKFDKAAGNYSLFQLTKENPILKKTEDEKTASDRNAAEKEAKTRQIEKAKEFKDF